MQTNNQETVNKITEMVQFNDNLAKMNNESADQSPNHSQNIQSIDVEEIKLEYDGSSQNLRQDEP